MQKLFTTISLSISLFTGIASAQVFQTGQAARAVIGQPTFTSQISGGVNSTATDTTPGVQTPASDTVFGAMGGLGYAAGTLFVADSNRLGILPTNNRVLMFNTPVFPYGPLDEIPPFTARCALCGGQASVILGQPDITTVAAPNPPASTSMRLPLGVASDGQHVAVADTANNRVLIWNSRPTSTGQPADLVLGQPNFTSFLSTAPTASSMRGPQGVWFQNGKFFVADTGNNRILIWTSIPTANNQPANVVLGQPNFTSGGQYNLVDSSLTVASSIMASPTSVTSDGTHLFVADLGFSRVLIWNSIPAQNEQPADLEIGQLDMTRSIANDSSALCLPNGTDSNGNSTYPATCLKTLNFPRFALADDKGRLYIADGGNDRVLVYNTIPTANAAAADVVLGQPDEFTNVVSSSQSILATGFPIVTSAANVTPTPTSLAWDGTNLYVADPTDFRILVFTPGQPNVPLTGIVNSASMAIFAQAAVLISGAIQENDTVTISIGANSAATAASYSYKIQSTDTLDIVAQQLASAINSANNGAGDPNVLVYERPGLATIVVVARVSGPDGNNITLATSTTPTSSAKITATASGATLTGGGTAGHAAPGTLISINAAPGTSLADTTASVPQGVAAANLPFSLGGVEVYSDGNRMPLLMVSPTQINTQIPWEVAGSNSTSIYLRTQHTGGSVTVTNAIGVPLLDSGAPGIFADTGTNEPRPGKVFHASSFASGVVTVSDAPVTTTTNGVTTTSTQAGDTGTITIGNRPYSYTTQSTDSPASIRAAFVNLINGDPEAIVTAAAAPVGAAIVVTAKVPGPLGNGITLGTNVTTVSTNTGGALLTLSASGPLCCANVVNRPVSSLNPAAPGETIYFAGTGLGLVCTSTFLDANNNCLAGDPAKDALITGFAYSYKGSPAGAPLTAINATVAGGAATVLSASVVPGTHGLYQIVIKLPSTLTADPFTQLFIQQKFNASNVVTMPVGDPLNF